jgi:predicted Zn-dependent protease
MILCKEEAHKIVENALDAANVEADALLVSTDQNISRFANSNLHQNMSEISAELTLRVIVDGAMGVASTTVFDANELAHTAELAREAARHSDPLQNFTGLYHGGEDVPRLRTFHDDVASIPPLAKAEALKTMFDRGRERGVQFAGAFGTAASSVACGNTHGVRRYCTMTTSEGTVIAIKGAESGYATAISRGLVDIVALGDEATLKATLAEEHIEDIEPGAFDVILEPPATAEVMEWLNMIAFTGQSFDDGSSFFVGNLGKRTMGENCTITDDALDESFMPFPFDVEGLPKRTVRIVERGTPRTPAVDTAYADRLGVAPTATAWSLGGGDHGSSLHTAVNAGNATREELIASTKLGIWVTRFNYVNGLLEPKSALMTGTTRDGTFLIRDGRIAARLPNLRWTQSIVEAYSNIESLTRERRAVGAWFNPFGATLAPVMKIRGWHFTGKQSGSS